ncbi:ketosteroid isomerase [Sphaerisporangium album]|uniref:Ketosteroid isomerase n=1 Tax=Sphaerisporangium album TaxID=509200 RepID=A0A367FQZ5_9ACTN|nr:nuclear transport factor 2 family protein [Sphaerisporangium album]RCG32035.1 ketosteroid isomerase [Sphaerisporangium album]
MPENAEHVRSPREVFERLAILISSGAWEELPGLYAEDVVVDIPLAIPEPMRVEGRDEVGRHLTDRVGLLKLRVVEYTVHETADPEVVVAEFVNEGEVVATGRTWRANNVQVLRVRDGLIVSSRDYHDHFRINTAFDRLPDLLKTTEDQS